MKEAGQRPRDPRLPIWGKPRSNPDQGGGMRRVSGAEVFHRASVSSAELEAIDPVGRLKYDVRVRGA